MEDAEQVVHGASLGGLAIFISGEIFIADSQHPGKFHPRHLELLPDALYFTGG